MEFDPGIIDRRLLAALENADLAYYIWDLKEDRCVFCTSNLAKIHGMATVEDYLATRMTVEEDTVFVHPDDRAKYLAAFADLMERGMPFRADYRIVGRDGRTRHVRELETATEFENGVPVRAEGTIQDVTAAVELEEKLRQAQKLEAIGNLTGGIAHDFNNILAVMLGNLEMLKISSADDTSVELIEAAIEAGQRGADLTRKMLSFARRASLQPRPIDLNNLVRDAKDWSARVLPANIAIETSLSDGLWSIEADLNSAESAFLNLVVNARDAMPDGGKLTVETTNLELAAEGPETRGNGLPPGRYVVLSITDSGSGIPEDRLSLIFEPFFTTKPPGAGSGLGLSMIQGFMNQSGGEIRVTSAVGTGTTFSLYFPAHCGKVVPSAPEPGKTQWQGQTNPVRIGLVEDEPALLKVLSRILSDAGYIVCTAISGEDALQQFAAGEMCDLLITDIVMPGSVDGPELAARLREAHPALPVVYISGYAKEAVDHYGDARPSPDDIRLMKPVDRDSLIEAIERAITKAGSNC